MKKIITLICLYISIFTQAQIGINTTAPNGMLDINSAINGFLMPRVALTANNIAAPVVNPQGGGILESTMIYNTATVVGVNGVSPGYYYWDTTKWVSFTGTNSKDWSLNGNNSITNPATPVTYGTSTIGATENFLGTTDASDIVFGTNNIERMRIKQTNGFLGLGTASPTTKLDILSPGNTLGLRILSGNAGQISYLSLGKTYEYAQIGAATAGTFFTDALDGDMAIKNFNTGKILFGSSFIAQSAMAIIPGGFIGINTSNPATLLDIKGINNWDTSTTEGDFRLGDATYRLKIGIANAGAGAGDIRITAQGGTNRIFLGNATNTTLTTIDGLNNRVGIKNVISPNSVFDIAGDLALREGPALVLTNTTYPIITLPAGNEYSHYRITGPTIPFWPYIINGGNDGQVLTLINTTGQNMNIYNYDLANGIITGTGNHLLSTSTTYSSVTMIYNATLQRWIVKSYTGMNDNRDWYLNGNTAIITPAAPVTYGTSTIAATENFIGTKDGNDVVFGTNNIERMRLKLATGNLGIGTSNPIYKLHVSTPNPGVYATFSENNYVGASDGVGIFGRALNNPGYGYGGYFDGNYMGIRANTSATTYAGTAYGGFFTSSGTVGTRYGIYSSANGGTTNYGNYSTATSGTTNLGVYGYALGTTNNFGGFFEATGGTNNVGLNVNSGGIGTNLGFFSIGAIVASPTAGKGITVGGEYIGIEARTNYVASATVDRMPGLFYTSNGGGFPSVATVGAVVDNVVYKILGFGTVNTMVKDDSGKERIMAAPEAPEALFQDYGIGKLTNGYAKIDIDPILTKNIRVDETHPLKVFIQLEGDCNGVYVINKSATSFEVKELQNGNSNVSFSYQIVAFRADEERSGVLSKYSDMRFKPLNRELKVVENKLNLENPSAREINIK